MKVLRKQISWAAVWSKDDRANKPETRGDKRAGRGQCTGNELAFWHCPLFSFVQLARFFFLRLNGPRGPYVIAVFRREWTKQLINAIVNKTFYRWTLSRQEPSSKRHLQVSQVGRISIDSFTGHEPQATSENNTKRLQFSEANTTTLQVNNNAMNWPVCRFWHN